MSNLPSICRGCGFPGYLPSCSAKEEHEDARRYWNAYSSKDMKGSPESKIWRTVAWALLVVAVMWLIIWWL